MYNSCQVDAEKTKAPAKYLTAEQRRAQLMKVAADLVGKRGWEALGMAPLAEAAGVSRQLVYVHFKDLDTLNFEVTRYLFEGAFEGVVEALGENPDDLDTAARTGLRKQLELPRGARLALRELTCGPVATGTALERLRVRTRKQVTDLWMGPMLSRSRLAERKVRSLAWMMTVASWGLLDLVDEGRLTAEEAADFYSDACRGALAALGKKKE